METHTESNVVRHPHHVMAPAARTILEQLRLTLAHRYEMLERRHTLARGSPAHMDLTVTIWELDLHTDDLLRRLELLAPPEWYEPVLVDDASTRHQLRNSSAG